MTLSFKLIPVDQLQAGQYQIREDFSEENLRGLASSIAQQGLIEPLVVREITTDAYEIIAGERRWRAAKMLGMKEVPCMLADYNDVQACAINMIENIQRQALNPIEEAMGYRRLRDEFGFQQEDMAACLGKSRSHIANLLRLLKLCPEVQKLLISEDLSQGHARCLVGLREELQLYFAETLIKEGWSVRILEKRIQLLKTESTSAGRSEKPSNPDLQRLQNVLSDQLGTPVEIAAQGQSGWLKIKYFDNDTLSGLLERFGLKTEE